MAERQLTTLEKITTVFRSMANLVTEKNIRYGDAALAPAKIFSKLSPEEGLKIRLDDKISRIINSDEIRKNDVADIMGYLCLLCVSNDWLSFDDLLD